MEKLFDFIRRTVDAFKLNNEKEEFDLIYTSIDNGVVFKGTNLWILVFAIFIASLGLNVNSSAVIIGAMLISPLMGPIIGMGFGIATTNLELLKKASYNYLFAALVGITTSTIYFSLTPINVAQTEMLARTSPNIYDVLIAFFGGLAGIVAIASKMKGNVIPGVAIATALMPPLCTAGYGLATLQLEFFFGAFYLFFINTVFISLATLLTARILKFPQKEIVNTKIAKRTNRIILIVTILTILPSIYFGYTMVQQDRYNQKAAEFIKSEIATHPIPNVYLLKEEVDAANQKITLTYGGELIPKEEQEAMKRKLSIFKLENTTLEIKQGFANLKDQEEINPLAAELLAKEKIITSISDELKIKDANLDSVQMIRDIGGQVYKELKAQYSTVSSLTMQPGIKHTDSMGTNAWLVQICHDSILAKEDRTRIRSWLKARVNGEEVFVNFNSTDTTIYKKINMSRIESLFDRIKRFNP
ncbi:MAG: DUF389 domain-containing protein [Bacteroidota bacterium]|nr:DUF389 domain-containing protein [Bacteroidota bacterium]